jgi:hypothetical protein
VVGPDVLLVVDAVVYSKASPHTQDPLEAESCVPTFTLQREMSSSRFDVRISYSIRTVSVESERLQFGPHCNCSSGDAELKLSGGGIPLLDVMPVP